VIDAYRSLHPACSHPATDEHGNGCNTAGMRAKDPPNDILVDVDFKRFVDLLRDSKTAKARVSLL
jgi:hypothetical protein